MNSPSHTNRKAFIARYWNALSAAAPGPALEDVVRTYTHRDTVWNGVHPLNTVRGQRALIAEVWGPLRHAMPDFRIEPYILMGGGFDGETWVAGTGSIVGTFAHDWLNLPVAGHTVRLRFGDFHLVQDDKIGETCTMFDLLALIHDLGFALLPEPYNVPGSPCPPSSGDGVMTGDLPAHESAATLQLIEDLIFSGFSQYDQTSRATMDMARFWTDKTVCYGPAGVGTTVGLDAFQDRLQGPFLSAFAERKSGYHRARFAEGCYGASTGWPGVRAVHRGMWMGCPPSDEPVSIRTMEFWRREGDVVAECWTFVDVIDVYMQAGIDLFRRLREMRQQREDGSHTG